jgi:hypothetical protein
MRAYLIIPFLGLLGLLAACEQPLEKHSELRWATVDKNQLQRSMTDIIHQLNPYPEEIYFDRSTVSNQLKALRRDHKMVKNECIVMPPEIDPKEASILSEREVATMLRNRRIPVLNGECLSEKDLIARLAAIDGEIKALETLTGKRQVFDKNISRMATEATTEAVKNYARGRYDLIVNTRAKDILFNSDKVVLDVTQAIVENYREAHIPLNDPSAQEAAQETAQP